MTIQQQIESFHAFATSQVTQTGADLSMDQLYCLWRAKNPLPVELSASVSAIEAAYAELESGEQGRPARLTLRESCQRLGLVVNECPSA